MLSPERPTFSPADQSVDKWAGQWDAASERSRNPQEDSGESWRLLKTSRGKAGRFCPDLFGSPANRRLEAKINGLNLYESMSRRHGNRTCLSPSQDSAANYENCLKCGADRCHPPPRVTPADMYGNMVARSGLTERESRKHEAAAEQERHCEGSQSQEGPCGEEGKGLLSFCASISVCLLLFALSLPFVPPLVFINKKHFSPGFDRFYRLLSLELFLYWTEKV